MADKTIGQLPALSAFGDDILIPAQDAGVAKKATGSQIKQFALDAVAPSVQEVEDIAAEMRQQAATPFVIAATAEAMTDKTKAYVYTGSESGYTNGAWYYWNGSAWTMGGTAVDPTLSIAGAPADAAKVGELKSEIENNAVIIGDFVQNEYVKTDGTIEAYNGWARTGYLNISRFEVLNITKRAGIYNCFYDANKEFISSITLVNGTTRVNVPDNAKYIIVSDNANYINALQITGEVVDTSKITELETGVNDITSTLYGYNAIDIMEMSKAENSVIHGISYAHNSDGSWTISGTATANSSWNIITAQTALPDYIKPGRTYHIDFHGGTIPLRIYLYYTDGTNTFFDINDSPDFTIPENTKGIIIRWQIASGTTVDETVKYTMIGLPLYVSGGQNIYNTYNITTTPTITTDSNGWLQAVDTDTTDETGKTDMTGAIMSMLTDTGYCHLGEGIFYVSGNINMPKKSMLCGCGDRSQIRLLQSTTSGYCVKLDDYCTIKDVSFSGSPTLLQPTTQGTRDGVHFTADYSGSPRVKIHHCVIDNVIFRDFSGSGLYCNETSISPEDGLYATNLYFYDCYVGININRYSEFNKFTNICTDGYCYYGVINNGGNNVFTACTFRAVHIGFYIDGTQPNSAHGTINGCTFCHIGSNTGSAITIESVTNGFVVSNCQIWYNSIDLTSASGIVFDGCEFGGGVTGSGASINISGGDLVMFAGCVFMNDVAKPPVFTITNNSKVKIDACYGSVSGNAITL